MLQKARESLETYGWLSPLIVRQMDGFYQLVDGEHRLQIAKEFGATSVPIYVVELTDAEAKKATLILNDLHGQARPDKLSELLRDLTAEIGVDELLVALPYSSDMLGSLLPNIELPSLPVGPLPSPAPPAASWVERTYRIPLDVAAVLDEALEKAKDGENIAEWQALERIAADFLSS